MRMVIEFYRVREADEARAVIGRETVDAKDLNDAIAIGLQFSRTLDMPQRPDALSLRDIEGNELYSATLGSAGSSS